MAVHQIGDPPFRADVLQQVVHEAVEMRPQAFLTQVASRTAAHAHNPRPRPDFFCRLGVVVADFLVFDQAGDQVHPLDLFVGAEGPGELDHVGGLPTGIGIAPQLQVVPADQPVDADQHDVLAVVVWHGCPLGSGNSNKPSSGSDELPPRHPCRISSRSWA
jgi:hypothetical protein